MFSLYSLTMFILFVYFAFFLEHFYTFFEDLFLIIAFLSFISIVFQILSTISSTYFVERAQYIRTLYFKLFARRQEAIHKNIELLDSLYLKNDKKFISQYAALFYLKFMLNIKLQKEIQHIIDQTAAQALFIELQKELTKSLLQRLELKYKKK